MGMSVVPHLRCPLHKSSHSVVTQDLETVYRQCMHEQPPLTYCKPRSSSRPANPVANAACPVRRMHAAKPRVRGAHAASASRHWHQDPMRVQD